MFEYDVKIVLIFIIICLLIDRKFRS